MSRIRGKQIIYYKGQLLLLRTLVHNTIFYFKLYLLSPNTVLLYLSAVTAIP